MLHGNPLLRGWTLSDVSFYTTELPEYMLVELARGLNEGVIHIAAATTYTLAILLAALLAKGRTAGWTAAAGVCIAAGIMLAPQLSLGVDILLSSPDHIGTSVPVMLAWLLLDRFPPGRLGRARRVVPVSVSLLLGWAAVADALVDYVAVAPLVLVCVIRAVQARTRGRASSAWHEITLAAGAVLAVVAARLALRLIPALGGFVSPAPVSHLATFGIVRRVNLPVTGHGLLLLFGADFLDYPVSVFLVLHLAGLVLAAAGAALALWRFLPDRDLVSQLLLAGIVIILVLFAASTSVAGVPTIREADVVLPFGAALAGRQLGPRIAALARPAAVSLGVALGLVGAGYVAGLAHEIAPQVPPTQAERLTAWLESHHLDSGLSGYWESNVVTLTSGGRVRIRQLTASHVLTSRDGVTARRLTPQALESDAAWYDPAAGSADFVVLSATFGQLPGFSDRAGVLATFGRPARSYRADGCTILVWPRVNLLADLEPAPARRLGKQ